MPGSGKGQTVSGHSKTMTSSITVAIVCPQSGPAFYRGAGLYSLSLNNTPGQAADCEGLSSLHQGTKPQIHDQGVQENSRYDLEK